MTKMNPEIKARWVAALRSGEYKQGKSHLRRGGKHCCLGVLCDLYAKDAGLESWDANMLGGGAFNKTYHDFNQVHGPEVVIWSGVDPMAEVRLRGYMDKLYEHNDAGCTFAEIADAIEEQL